MITEDGFEIEVLESTLFDNALLVKVVKRFKYGESQAVPKELLDVHPEAVAEIAMQMMNHINDRINCSD